SIQSLCCLCDLLYLTSPLLLFFFHATAPTEIYTLSLHDALPISLPRDGGGVAQPAGGLAHRGDDLAPGVRRGIGRVEGAQGAIRSEEHTSELQSLAYLVCRLLLEKKKKK